MGMLMAFQLFADDRHRNDDHQCKDERNCKDDRHKSTTLIPFGSTWKYLDDGSDLGTAWREPGFDDSSWSEGPAQLGYGEDYLLVQTLSEEWRNRRVTLRRIDEFVR